jgi:hypothetical protein
MKCPLCAARIEAAANECPDCGYLLSEDAGESSGGRPSEVTLAIRLLGGSVAFSFFTVFRSWSFFGWDWVASHQTAWIRPGTLALSAILIALAWMGNSWARTMLLVAIAWDVISTVSAATLIFAIGGARLLAMLSWVNLAVELCAAWLLLQSDSLDWFRSRG